MTRHYKTIGPSAIHDEPTIGALAPWFGNNRRRNAGTGDDQGLADDDRREGSPWHWRRLTGRKQTNDDAPEVLITKGGFNV